MKSKPARILTLGLCSLLSSFLHAEPKLEADKYSSPGLQGYFGNPVLGNPSDIVSSRVLWHPNGRIFARVGPLDQLCMWEAEAQTQQAHLRALLNVGGAWSVSHRGDLLCAKSRRGAEGPNQKGISAQVLGDFGCFRMADGVRLWSLPARRDEGIIGAEFTLDDAGVAVLSIHARQMTLRLLDAKDGRELKRHDFDLPEDRHYHEKNLMMRKDAVWVKRKLEGTYRWVAFPLVTFKPEVVVIHELEEEGMGAEYFQTSPDGRWLAACTDTRYVIWQQKGGKWVKKHSGVAQESNQHGFLADRLMDLLFLPDNRRAVIWHLNKVRVIELSSGKDLAMRESCFFRSLAVAPDGKRLLVAEHGVFTILSADTLKPASSQPRQQHVMQPSWLRFLGDGRTLASAAADGVWLWDVASRKPRALLQTSVRNCPGCALKSPVFANGEQALVADEGLNFVTWKLPDLSGLVPAAPVVIAPQPAFGMALQTSGNSWSHGLFTDPKGQSFITVQQSGAVLRDGLGAGASKTLSNEPLSFTPVSQGFLDLPENRFVYLDSQKYAWIAMDLETGTKTTLAEDGRRPSVMAPPREGAAPSSPAAAQRRVLIPMVALPNAGLSVGRVSYREFCLTDYSGGGLARWLDPAPVGTKVQEFYMCAVSQDETHFAALLEEEGMFRQSVGVWDVVTGKLLAAWPLPASPVTSMALSPDGSLLACGHHHGSISLWKLADLILEQERKRMVKPAETGATSTPAAAKPSTPAVGNPSAQRPGSPRPVLPLPVNFQPSKERRIMHLHVSSWGFQDDGHVTKTEFPETGRLRVDGQAFESSGNVLTPSPDLTDIFNIQRGVKMDRPGETRLRPEDRGKINGGIISQSEGRAGHVWVARQTGVPASQSCLVFTDSFTNTGTEPHQAVIEWDAVFPEGTGGLLDSSFKPVQMGENGRVITASGACWIAGLVNRETATPVPVIAFRSASSGHMPDLVWVAEECRLKIRHVVTLLPGETRHLAHGVSLIRREAGTTPEIFNEPPWEDFSLWVPNSVRDRGVNFGVDLESYTRASQIQREKLPRDVLGLPWEIRRDGSIKGGLGASSALQLWINEAPLNYSAGHLFDCQTHAQLHGAASLAPFYEVMGKSVDRKLHVKRLIQNRVKTGTLLIDTIRNGHTEPVKTRIRLVSTFAEPIMALHTGAGKTMTMVLGEPLKDTDGSLVVEVSGETRPATLICFHQEGADLNPEIRLVTPQMIGMDYELEIEPNTQVVLYHWATQRPISSFGSLDKAFADCLPFSREWSTPLIGRSNMR